MRTLVDVVEGAADLVVPEVSSGQFPPGYKSKLKLSVVGDGSLVLPSDSKGLIPLSLPLQQAVDAPDEALHAARVKLLCYPSATFPLEKPDDATLKSLGVDPEKFRAERPRGICCAIALRLPDKRLIYGVAQVIALEHGLRMGSTQLLSYNDRWSFDLDEAEEWLFDVLRSASHLLQIGPERGTKPWRTVVALLGGIDDEEFLPKQWKRQMSIAAGLRRVKLDIRPSPETARREIIRDLKTLPPDALLVWVDWVPNPEPFTTAYLLARPQGRADVLGTRKGEMDFEDTISELFMHLREIAPIVLPGESSEHVDGVLKWREAEEIVVGLISSHFVLTDRARKMLKDNPYMDARRMVRHLRQLEGLARVYRERSGMLGDSLENVARSDFEIDVALFDDGISGEITYEGETFFAVPHVKVDDHKKPDKCGRIYFAIDKVESRFIVDHVGLHDYY